MQYLGFTLLVFLALEVLSIVLVAKAIGGLATFGLMILFFMAGSFLMKRSAGLSKLMLAVGMLNGGGRLSLYQMLYPIRIPFAAFLLMLPGFLSDLAALLLLLPFGGSDSGADSNPYSPKDQSGNFQYYRHTQRGDEGDDVIEGDFTVKDRPKQPETRRENIIDQ